MASIGENSTSSQSSRGLRHRGAGQALDVLARGLQLVLDVDVRGRDEGVDARALGVAHRLPGAVDVGGVGTRQAGDHGSMDLAGDRLHGLEVAGRGDREARLDDVDAQARELVGDLELLGRVERDARATARRRAAWCRRSVLGRGFRVVMSSSRWASSCGFSVVGLRLRGRHALFPPRGEEEKSEGERERHASAKRSRARRGAQGAAPAAASFRRANDQDRALGEVQQPRRRRAHQRALQRALAVGADDDHARVVLVGHLDERLGRGGSRITSSISTPASRAMPRASSSTLRPCSRSTSS